MTEHHTLGGYRAVSLRQPNNPTRLLFDELPAPQRGSIAPTALQATDGLWQLSGSFRLVTSYLPSSIPVHPFRCILMVQRTDGRWEQHGTPTFPLHARVQPITHSKAHDIVGYELLWEGQQTTPPTPLEP